MKENKEILSQKLLSRFWRGFFAIELRVIRRGFVLSLLFLYPSSFILHPSEAGAQDLYAGEFLQIPVGSRALGMGGAYTAIANDESAFHWNPAGVALIPDQLVGFMYSAEYGTPGNSLADFYQLGFTYPMKDMTLALNWIRLSVGDLNQTPDLTNVSVTDERAQLVNEIYSGAPNYFSDNEDAVVLSIARDNKFTLDWGWLYYKEQVELPIGINFKIIHQAIGSFGTANAIGVDGGAMLRFSLGEFLLNPSLGNIAFGVSVTDIAGTQLAWSTQRTEIIPMQITSGIAYTQPIPAIHSVATFSSDFIMNESTQPRFGLEMTYEKSISLRLGLDQGEFTTGAGYNWDHKIDINYSLSINDALGPENRLSFSADLDNILKKDTTSE
jgi:Uncharacterised protein family (UPF0164)